MIDYRRIKQFGGVALIGALVALLPATASAGVIFTNFGASLAYDVTQGNAIGNDFAGGNDAEGDSFTPTANAYFDSALVALSCVAGCPASANFTISLTADGGDQPGLVLESFSFTGETLDALGSDNAPILVTSVLNPTLFAGTEYWITVSSSIDFTLTWNNNSTGDTNDQAFSSDGGLSWFSPSGATPGALEVDGTATPEPSAGLLAGAGLLVVWLRKRVGARKG